MSGLSRKTRTVRATSAYAAISVMVRPASVAGISKKVTRSTSLVNPAATKSCVGSGWVTVKLDAGRIDGRPVAVDLAPVARPQAATRSDALIATPTSTRFIDRAKDSPVPLFQVCEAGDPTLVDELIAERRNKGG